MNLFSKKKKKDILENNKEDLIIITNNIEVVASSETYQSQIGQDENGQRYVRYYNTFTNDFGDWKITEGILVGNDEYYEYAIQFFGSDFKSFIPNFNFSSEYAYKTDLDLTFIGWYPRMFNEWANNFKNEFIYDIKKCLIEYGGDKE